MTSIIDLPWLRFLICSIIKTLSMKDYCFIYDNYNMLAQNVLPLLWFSFFIIIWKVCIGMEAHMVYTKYDGKIH